MMSLDVMRALHKSDGECLSAFRSFVGEVAAKSREASDKRTRKSAEIVGACADRIVKHVEQNQERLELRSRDLALSLAQVYIGALLADQCCSPTCSNADVRTLWQWTAERDLAPIITRAERGAYDGGGNATTAFVFDGYDPKNAQQNAYEQ